MFIKNRSQMLITHCLWGLSWLRRFVMSHLPPSCQPLCSVHMCPLATTHLVSSTLPLFTGFGSHSSSDLCASLVVLSDFILWLTLCFVFSPASLLKRSCSLFLHPEVIIMSSQCANKGLLCGVSFNASLRIISYQYLAAVSRMELSRISAAGWNDFPQLS